MSPEQASGEPVDERTDIWAFGCLVFEMLTGCTAFGRQTVLETLAAVREAEPDWTLLPETVPPGVLRLLRRCLAKDPRRRLRSIGDAALEIDEALGPPGAGPKESSKATTTLPPGHRARRYVFWAASTGIIAALAATAVNRLGPVGPEARVMTFAVAPPAGATFPNGSGAPWPSISPDGRLLAFVATRGGQQRLWIRPLDSAVARELEGTDGVIRPFWSPDSQSLGYFANGTLARVHVDTGAVRVLTGVPYTGGLAGTWGDGVIVYTSVEGLRRIPAGGGEATLFMPRTEQREFLVPGFIGDGRRFLYTQFVPRSGETRLCLGSLDSPETRCGLEAPSVARYVAPGYLLAVQTGTLVAVLFDLDRLEAVGVPQVVTHERVEIRPEYTPPPFSSAGNVLAYAASPSPALLTWLDRAGVPQGEPVGTGGRPAFSPDGRQLVVERQDPQMGTDDLWLLDLERGTESRITSDRGGDSWPTFSPDGSRIVYSSTSTGLRVRGTSGDADRAIGVPGASPHFSPDGRLILFQRQEPKTGFDLWVVPVEGGQAPAAFAQTEHGEREGRFSPDGRWVAYDATETGRREVWIQPFPATGSRWQISTQGGVSPQWRSDGKELFYVAADGTLMGVPIQAGTTMQWGTSEALFKTMFAGGVYASYAVSADGQRFLVPVSAGGAATPITVIVNWTAALRE
jgi:Tol biopolymer transport system component